MLKKLVMMPFSMSLDEQEKLRKFTLEENLFRGRLFARIIIGVECAMAAVGIAGSLLQVHESFKFSFYLIMYMFMILINIGFLWVAAKFEKDKKRKKVNFLAYERAFQLYSMVFMLWGSIVTLADQRLYGQLMAFVVNMISISVIFYFTNRQMVILYGVSTLLLFAGLPFVQPSSEVLVGHYINLIVFLFFSWVASRILYVTYCSNSHSRIQLKQSNQRLEEEITENKRVHVELERANQELQRLSLVDVLTGIPNRRAFEQEVQQWLKLHGPIGGLVSLMMIDIDYFKLFNDNYGHAAGDEVITMIAQVIHEAADTPSNIAARLGGEEFVLAAFGTGEKQAGELAENIRQHVSEMKIRHEYSAIHPYVTVSLGTATGRISNAADFSKLMLLADQALYAVKAGGRNSVKSLK
ncbi:GGDEF domain-containing protein [Paenibacillus albidus]|uniref:GGDEF domain-containing protein n=1 Tax=Paenibacillus albidus TaxID=2041023 RepID=UPI001BEC668A|nr:GGDEF domain-containing protein [Paenibacillus albidus]MBT2291238.1 GGDEF domain-containing protein [Paenibacillus albidus]